MQNTYVFVFTVINVYGVPYIGRWYDTTSVIVYWTDTHYIGLGFGKVWGTREGWGLSCGKKII